ALRWRPPVRCHVLGDRGLPDVDAELEEFSMNPGSAPKWVGDAHVADQLANLERHLWSATAIPRLPSPERTKTSTMPIDNSLRLDDHQGIHNARRQPIEASKDQAIKIAESEPLR